MLFVVDTLECYIWIHWKRKVIRIHGKRLNGLMMKAEVYCRRKWESVTGWWVHSRVSSIPSQTLQVQAVLLLGAWTQRICKPVLGKTWSWGTNRPSSVTKLKAVSEICKRKIQDRLGEKCTFILFVVDVGHTQTSQLSYLFTYSCGDVSHSHLGALPNPKTLPIEVLYTYIHSWMKIS